MHYLNRWLSTSIYGWLYKDHFFGGQQNQYFSAIMGTTQLVNQGGKYGCHKKNRSPTTIADWWFGTWHLLFHRLGIIIPSDFHVFFRGVGIPPVTIGVANIKTLLKSDCWWNMYIAPANYPVVWKELFGSIGIHIPYIFPIKWGAKESLRVTQPNE